MTPRHLIASLIGVLLPLAAAAQPVLQFPEGSSRAIGVSEPFASARLPMAPYADGRVDSAVVEGRIRREVWRTPAGQADTLKLLAALRGQLESAGFEILFSCATDGCGGFDFRFDTEVLPEPEMHVDLGDFRYLTARRPGEAGEEYVGLLVSRSPERGFVQVVRAGPATGEDTAEIALSTKQRAAGTVDPGSGETLAARLLQQGAVPLEGLEFDKGAASLGGDAGDALAALAAFLEENPEQAVILVGHTDASGSLEANLALSRKRADAVMKRLIQAYGADPAQLSAQGVGYLSPRASNATEEGRHLNRRVEAVLTAPR